MRYSRRYTLQLGAGTLAGAALTMVLPMRARAQATGGDSYPVEGGEIVIRPVEHASLVMTTPGMVIYADPVGGAGAYQGLPPPDLILITHEHGDHFDAETLAAIAGENTRLLTNPAVHGMLPADLQAKATAIANGESTTANDVGIEAIPAYNTTPDRLQYHPEGRDNGYVLTIGDRRVYIAGDTEDIPEMRALAGIDIAFVPMNLPYTMTVQQAASGVAAFAPAVVYPYHYAESDVAEFARLVAESGAPTEVAQRDWYPAD
jgi:L-ascorbate metabolism protein UlaG (beta-lactamase superfamily)